MKTASLPKIVLKKAPQGLLRWGHPWIYRSQIAAADLGVQPGSLVEVFTDRQKRIGVGYYNPQSEITARLFTREETTVDAAWIRSRIVKAFEYRRLWVRETNAYRVISSEADELPGLIVDLYGEVLVVQFLTLGMELLRDSVLDALKEVVPNKGIYERSDSSSRRIEGLEERTGWIEKNCGDEVIIVERDVQYNIHFGTGHKTGFYLDQRENRLLLRDLGLKGRALDAFSYESAFGIHLAKGGMEVLSLDIQADCVARAKEHAKRNQVPADRLKFKVANVFDELKEMERQKEKFDLIVLDPPSFVKKKAALEGALAGFKEILLRSMKLLNTGGALAVFSCSYHVDENRLMQTSMAAASDVGKTIRILNFMKQSTDHPINPFIPETYYLKGFLFEVS